MNKNTLKDLNIPYLTNDEIDKEAVYIIEKYHKTRYISKLILKFFIRLFIFILFMFLLFSLMN